MVQGNSTLHHIHKRKRVHQNLEPYPSKNKLKRFFDKLVYVVVFAGMIMTFPQIYNVWILKLVEGVSVLTWGTYVIGNIIWLMYGFLHKDKPIITSNIIWMIANASVAIGVLINR